MKKYYTLRYSKSGIMQYVDFTTENNILVNPTFGCAYQPANPLPNVAECKTIKEVIDTIAEYSFDKKCEIYMVNYRPVDYKKSDTNNLKLVDIKITELFQQFFELSIKPILPKNCEIKYCSFYIKNTQLKDLPKYEKFTIE